MSTRPSQAATSSRGHGALHDAGVRGQCCVPGISEPQHVVARLFSALRSRPKKFYPEWHLYLVETPSREDAAATQTPISWGVLLGFPDDPRENSPEFQAAVHRLEAMGVEESVKEHNSLFALKWRIGHLGRTEVEGTHASILPADSPTPFSTQFRKLLDGFVPPVVQMRAFRDTVVMVQQTEHPRGSGLEVVLALPGEDMEIPERTICERTRALAQTPTTKFTLGLDWGNLTPKIAVDVGFQLSTLLCNHPVAGATWSLQALQPVSRSVQYEELELKCMAHGPGVPAICSAIAELSLTAKELNFSAVGPTSEAAWSWLAYALFCGSSSVGVDSVEIQRARLTYADVLAVRDVVLNKYPKPLSVPKLGQKPDYGFVYLRAGAKLWLNDCKRDEGPQLVTSAPGRYLAVKNPTHESGRVEVVVPGYGICTTELEDDEKDKFVTSDGTPFVEDLVHRTSFLTMWLASVKNDTVVTKLLTLIGWGLKSLKLIKTTTELLRSTITRENQAQLELSLLAEACPCLRDVVVAGFNVTVAADSEALGNWGVYQMWLMGSFGVPDLAPYLADPTHRLTQSLSELEIKTALVDTKEAQALKAFDGDLLPKLRTVCDSKAMRALISIVDVHNAGKSKAIGRLDSSLLSLILKFAKTPIKRSVIVDGFDEV